MKKYSAAFRNRRDSIQDGPRSERPATAANQGLIARNRDLVMAGRRLTMRHTTATVGISHPRVLSRTTEPAMRNTTAP